MVATNNNLTNVGAAALGYARRGWRVLPLWWPAKGGCACGGGCGNPAKHPMAKLAPRGVYSATIDPAVLRRWWRTAPWANVGVATGGGSGLLVVDVDPRSGGALERLPGPVPTTPTVRTGGGGWHLYLAWPEGVTRLPQALPGCPGVDLKGPGGYVVAPPSRHLSGRAYEWLVPPDVPLAPPPAWLLEAIRPSPRPAWQPLPGSGGAHGTPYGRAALRQELARLAHTPVGNRNNALNRAAFALGRLVAASHLDEGTVVGLLTSLGYQIGLGGRETEKTTQSGLTAGLREV